MDREDALEIMSHLANKLEDVLEVEDLVSAFAEFMAHIKPNVSEEDFAFLATIGAMICQKGHRKYDSCMQTDFLLERVRG